VQLATFEVPFQKISATSGPAEQPCRIEGTSEESNMPVSQAESIIDVRPYKQLLRGAMLPCASLTFGGGASSTVATVLLDADDPGTEPAELPAAQVVKGHPGIVSEPANGGEILARRITGAWLVVTKATSIKQGIALLERIHVGLDL
jgi:hypothetical protein